MSKAKEEELEGTPAEEELTEPAPEEEALPEETAPAEVAPIEGMVHTADEVPQLAGLSVGDPITFTVAEISEDGNSFTLTPAEAPEEAVPSPAGGGLGAITGALGE